MYICQPNVFFGTFRRHDDSVGDYLLVELKTNICLIDLSIWLYICLNSVIVMNLAEAVLISYKLW